eukprot:155826_1
MILSCLLVIVLTLLKNLTVSLNVYTFLNDQYDTDFTFLASALPYYVNKNVTFTATSDVSIENGVEIIFGGDYYIEINGNINCGCNEINTTNNNERGLADTLTFVYIHKDNIFSGNLGSINIVNTAGISNEIKFCNTKFSYLATGINAWYQTVDIIIDNVE